MTKQQALDQQLRYLQTLQDVDSQLYREENEIDFDDDGWFFNFYFCPVDEYEGMDIDLGYVSFNGDDDFEGAIRKLESIIEQLNEICDDDYIDNFHTECKDYVNMIRSVR
jgi:hypothetical protein